MESISPQRCRGTEFLLDCDSYGVPKRSVKSGEERKKGEAGGVPCLYVHCEQHGEALSEVLERQRISHELFEGGVGRVV